MELADFRCRTRLQVRWSEVDAQQIVFNAHYLSYADVASTAYWQQVGIPMPSSWRMLGGQLVVKKAAITYHASGRMGDLLTVGMRCVEQGTTSLHFEAGVFRGHQLLNSVALVYVLVDAQGQPMPIPEQLRALITQFEAGEPMLQLRTGSWNALSRWAERLRMEVFVQEQGVPAEIEVDAQDPLSLHAVLLNGLGQAVATGRLLREAPGVARIGRMAVAREMRGGGAGRQVLQALMQAARARGDHAAVLHSQVHAQEFYARAGYMAEGEVYQDAGIDHITMRCAL